MISFIVFIILLAIIFALGHIVFDYQGTVVVATETMVYDMKIVVALTFVVFALIGLYILSWLIVKVIRLIAGSRNWFGAYSSRQKNKAFYLSLNAFLMGDKTSASKYIDKTYGGDFHGANYLLAADLTDNDSYRQQLFAHASSESDAELASAVKNANSLLYTDPEKALDILEELPKKKQKHLSVVRAKLGVFERLNQWQQVKTLLKQNKKALGNDYLTWAQQATHGEFAEIVSKQGANALKDKWQQLPRAERNDVANQICYSQLLLDQGLSEEVEKNLVTFASKNQHPAFWGLFKQLSHKEPTAAKKFLEALIRKEPEVAEYYSVLAHVAYNADDLELAHKAISKALELKQTREDGLLLAAILEKQQAFEKANSLYRKLLHSH